MKYRIYYGNGSAYSDRDGLPENAPKVGVQVIVQQEGSERGYRIMQGTDCYWWLGDQWAAGDIFGCNDWRYYSGIGHRIDLRGLAIRDEEWEIIMRRATQEAQAGTF